MDICTEIQATYLETEGDKIQALLDAAARFTELGRVDIQPSQIMAAARCAKPLKWMARRS